MDQDNLSSTSAVTCSNCQQAMADGIYVWNSHCGVLSWSSIAHQLVYCLEPRLLDLNDLCIKDISWTKVVVYSWCIVRKRA